MSRCPFHPRCRSRHHGTPSYIRAEGRFRARLVTDPFLWPCNGPTVPAAPNARRQVP